MAYDDLSATKINLNKYGLGPNINNNNKKDMAAKTNFINKPINNQNKKNNKGRNVLSETIMNLNLNPITYNPSNHINDYQNFCVCYDSLQTQN